MRPSELLVDGDLLSLVKMLVVARGAGTTATSKVKGHADEGLVRGGRVREADKIGNDLADEAADFGRRRSWGSMFLIPEESMPALAAI